MVYAASTWVASVDPFWQNVVAGVLVAVILALLGWILISLRYVVKSAHSSYLLIRSGLDIASDAKALSNKLDLYFCIISCYLSAAVTFLSCGLIALIFSMIVKQFWTAIILIGCSMIAFSFLFVINIALLHGASDILRKFKASYQSRLASPL